MRVMRRDAKRAGLAVAAALAGLAFASAASAALVVQTGVDNQGTDNVINNPCTVEVDGPANVIKGCLNTDHDQGVTFTSTDLIRYAAGGQATITGDLDLSTPSPSDTLPFGDLKIELDGKTFDKLVLNIFALDDGQVEFNDGTNFSGLFNLDGNGQNFFTITGGPFSFIQFITYDTGVGFVQLDDADQVKQVRIGPTGFVVPEPATLALFGAGLAALGLIGRRRR